MAKRSHTLTLLLLALPFVAFAEPAPDGGNRDASAEERQWQRPGVSPGEGNVSDRKFPDARREGHPDFKRMLRNRKVWENMPEEEREVLRRKAREMQQEAKHRVERLLEQSGIQLAPGQREAFFRRYLEERRVIERQLRERMQRERERMEAEAIKKIHAEILGEPVN